MELASVVVLLQREELMDCHRVGRSGRDGEETITGPPDFSDLLGDCQVLEDAV
jgi:hypothetical protein